MTAGGVQEGEGDRQWAEFCVRRAALLRNCDHTGKDRLGRNCKVGLGLLQRGFLAPTENLLQNLILRLK
jgi:hypothetical protein